MLGSVTRRPVALLAVATLLASILVALSSEPVAATPVATEDGTYTAFGRAFPDPHGCVEGAPTKSPHANGNVCAGQFVQWDEAIDGLKYLERKFPRYIQVLNLRTQYGDHPEFTGEDFRSAGLPREDLSRDQKDLYMVKVTDRDPSAPLPEADRKHFVYSLSIHGIERAGLEGGIRAVEDLATWAACENGDAPDQIDCAAEGSTPDDPRRLLDPFDEEQRSPTAGDALANGVIFFMLSNPDGWSRGDYSQGGVFYQRYNGNGMDLNRDWATVGYSDPAYTSFSEPETRAFSKWLKWVSDTQTSDGHFAGGIDLHGMVTANSLSYTLLGAGQKDYRKNQITVDTALMMWRDAEERLTWSPHVARAEDCPGPVPEPFFGQGRTTAPMCTVQWGTVWDTIEYQITGGMGDWIDNPVIGLGGIGINNEMALSHLAPNNVFEPDIVQLQIEGNKSLVYSQVTALLFEEDVAYEPGGRIAYVDDPSRVQSDGSDFVVEPDIFDLPTQDDIEGHELNGLQGFEFEVKGPNDGFFNGGMTVEATYANARGISPNSAQWAFLGEMTLEYCGRTDGAMTHQHAHEVGAMSEHGCEEVAHGFNQSPLYVQAGVQLELNRPEPGLYRVQTNAARTVPTRYHVRFSRADAIPGWDDQAPYDVSRTDFFDDLNDFVAEGGEELVGLSVSDVVADPSLLRTFDTVVVADRFMPEDGDREDYAAALAGFVEHGGNLVLTDGAVAGLADLGVVPADAVERGVYYAGYVDFNDGDQPTFDRHPLTEGIQKDGTASGRQTLSGEQYYDRRQTYEPVPMGYLVGGPSTCSSGCDAPIWVVDEEAWLAAGGLHLGRSFVRPGPEGGSGWDGVSLGEVAYGDGVIRILGALLPEPTQDNFHPYGLASYGLTYTGYQLFENATTWTNEGRQDPGGGEPAERGVAVECIDCEISVRAGESGTAELRVRNTGDVDENFHLAADIPDGWSGDVEPATQALAAGDEATVQLTVEPPRNAKGTHEVDVSATSEDGELSGADTVSVEVTKGRPSSAGQPDDAALAGAESSAASGVAVLAVLALMLAAGVLRRRVRVR
ncbi:MAG: hypothetical protein KY469_22090 [Actinobacteria bacterium]|nr:hypothetical protein [Actinomycetota bacterium]